MTERTSKQAVQGKEIYATFDDEGFHIFEKNDTIQMDEVRGASLVQQEADTKLFLCAKGCILLGASSICIHIIDTDVLVPSFYYSARVNIDISMFK